MPTENTDANFEEFFGAFDSEPDYQTETETETDDSSAAAEETELTEEPAEDAQGAEDKTSDDGNTEPTTDGDASQKPAHPADSYTLRVNHRNVAVSEEEYRNYAQKGVDYDRVKGQLEQAKNDNEGLRSQLTETQKIHTRLSELAKACNTELPDLLEQFEVAMYQQQGLSPDAAKERVARMAAERKLEEANAQKQAPQEESQQERANREIAEFAQRYPDVAPTAELAQKLAPDIQAGMTLSEAYEKYLSAEKDAQIQQLKAELEAERQNKANRASSPGSVKSVGSKKEKDKFDDFFDAFD